MWCQEGRQPTATPTSGCWKNSGSVSNKFSLKESCRNLAPAWQCKAAHKSEDLGSHHKIWVDSITHLPYSPDLVPSDFHLFTALEGFYPQYEVSNWWWYDPHSENLATSAGQGMVLTTNTNTVIPHWCKAVEVDGDFV
jgi:hypothetical protein